MSTYSLHSGLLGESEPGFDTTSIDGTFGASAHTDDAQRVTPTNSPTISLRPANMSCANTVTLTRILDFEHWGGMDMVLSPLRCVLPAEPKPLVSPMRVSINFVKP